MEDVSLFTVRPQSSNILLPFKLLTILYLCLVLDQNVSHSVKSQVSPLDWLEQVFHHEALGMFLDNCAYQLYYSYLFIQK